MAAIGKVYIPKWAEKALCIWAERAYRRGFQQGLLAGEKFNMMSYPDGFKFRYECAGQENPKDAREPLHGMALRSLRERHLEWDSIPFVETYIEAKGITLIKRLP